MKNVREIHRETDLPAEAGARNVFAPEEAETEAQPIAQSVLASSHGLKLGSPQISVPGISAINLRSEGKRRAEIMQQGEAAGENMAARVLGSQRAGTGVAGEQISQISSEPGFWGQGLLADQVEPVVLQS